MIEVERVGKILVYNTINLHVRDGEKNYCEKPQLNLPVEFGLQFNEAMDFYTNGFFILEQAVDSCFVENCRKYIDSQYCKWLKMSKRQDDWRCHFCLDLKTFDEPIENAQILDLLLKSPKILGRLNDLMDELCGIFYTQIAFRTPFPLNMKTKKENKQASDYITGAEYHLDGQANASGDRFPDHWTVLVGIALVDILTIEKGNFTVFPTSHTSRDWSFYTEEKKTKTLPNLGEPLKICLHAGDAVLCHVLLAHRGGKNELKNDVRNEDEMIKNIPLNTREMIFIRVQASNIDYFSIERSINVLKNPWYEHDKLFQKFPFK
jgi:hypothetical protein